MENLIPQLNTQDSKKLFNETSEEVKNRLNKDATPEAKAQSFEEVVEIVYKFVEDHDDYVQLVPIFGWFLKLLVDNPLADRIEREACRLFVQLVYRSVKPVLT